MSIVFIAGIDTDIGKTIAAGAMSRFLLNQGVKVITQKMVQTGCAEIAEDIVMHRRLEGRDLMPADLEQTTCPYLFSHAASPHLAAKMEHKTIDPEKILAATQTLCKQFDMVLLEGAGGLFVPLNAEVAILDYVKQHQYPVILISSSKLGSINHTLLSIEALQVRQIPLLGVVYNCHPATDPHIEKDSKTQIEKYLERSGTDCPVVKMKKIDPEDPILPDFSSLFETL